MSYDLLIIFNDAGKLYSVEDDLFAVVVISEMIGGVIKDSYLDCAVFKLGIIECEMYKRAYKVLICPCFLG